jgi:hypothetical protein
MIDMFSIPLLEYEYTELNLLEGDVQNIPSRNGERGTTMPIDGALEDDPSRETSITSDGGFFLPSDELDASVRGVGFRNERILSETDSRLFLLFKDHERGLDETEGRISIATLFLLLVVVVVVVVEEDIGLSRTAGRVVAFLFIFLVFFKGSGFQVRRLIGLVIPPLGSMISSSMGLFSSTNFVDFFGCQVRRMFDLRGGCEEVCGRIEDTEFLRRRRELR